jgi:hypothetical protein
MKYVVTAVVYYPCVIEADDIQEAIEIAENADWEVWPDDEAEIVEYIAEEIESVAETVNSAKPARPKFRVVEN